MNNTPTYHIELVIAGAGTFLALLLTSFGIWGIWLPLGSYFSPEGAPGVALSFLVIFTPFFYSIGIVTDRIADMMMNALFGKRIIEKNFSNESRPPGEAYLYSRSIIYLRSTNLKEIFEYSRMRIRICRAWTLNSILIFISSLFFLISADEGEVFGKENLTVLLFFSLLNLSSAFFTFLGWKSLTEKECQNLKFQLKVLQSEDKLINPLTRES